MRAFIKIEFDSSSLDKNNRFNQMNVSLLFGIDGMLGVNILAPSKTSCNSLKKTQNGTRQVVDLFPYNWGVTITENKRTRAASAAAKWWIGAVVYAVSC